MEEVNYDQLSSITKEARSGNAITEKEYKMLIGALIKSKFRKDPDPRPDLDPIIDKVLDYKFGPLETTKENYNEED